jgi:urease accessory protein
MNPPEPGAAPRARRRPSAAALFLAVAVVCLQPAPARAHGSLAVGDFYTGMLHPFLHFETVLPLLALALWSGQLGAARAWRLSLVFLGGALVGAVAGMSEIDATPARSLLRPSMLVLGLLVATRGRLPAWLAIGLSLCFGIQQGQVNTYDPEEQIRRPLLFLTGLGSSIGLVLFHVVTRVVRYRAFWVQTGVRVLGSWIAATGLLVLALEWAASR